MLLRTFAQRTSKEFVVCAPSSFGSATVSSSVRSADSSAALISEKPKRRMEA
jgi:hypothetical protein